MRKPPVLAAALWSGWVSLCGSLVSSELVVRGSRQACEPVVPALLVGGEVELELVGRCAGHGGQRSVEPLRSVTAVPAPSGLCSRRRGVPGRGERAIR